MLENIDCAPPEVLTSLAPLCERRLLHVPQRAEVVQAAPGFQLLGTLSSAPTSDDASALGPSPGHAGVLSALAGLWTHVHVSNPTPGEQVSILQALHPRLAPLLPALLACVAVADAAAGRGAWGSGGAGPKGPSGGAAGSVPGTKAAAGAAAAAAAAGAAAAGRVVEDAVHEVLGGAGLGPGELALHLQRRLALRDLLKWCARMEVRGGGKGRLACMRCRGLALRDLLRWRARMECRVG